MGSLVSRLCASCASAPPPVRWTAYAPIGPIEGAESANSVDNVEAPAAV